MTQKNITTTAAKRSAPSSYNARIKVVGIGGGGGHAVSRMYDNLGVRGVEFIAINTDIQDLEYCQAKRKIQIGKNLTRGLGAGMNPEIGRQAAEENRAEISETLKGADLVFLTAGLGGGSGSGGILTVADTAKENGILTVAVVTKPFAFEGAQRAKIAQDALAKLKEKVDTLIVVPNDKIFDIIKKDTPLLKAFEHIDDVLRSAVQGIAELIAMPGIVNVDFADIKAIMQNSGPALVGIGIASGQERATSAANQAIHSPLLEISVDGAKGVLFGISGGRDMRMTEINEIAKIISQTIDPSAKIIFGAYHDRKLKPGQIKVVLIATGFGPHFGRDAESVAPSLFNPEANFGLNKVEHANLNSVAPKEVPSPAKEFKEKNEKLLKEVKDDGKKSGAHIPPKKEDDLWDIPAFLRKRRRE